MPPAFIFEEIFKINWHKGVLLAGVLGSLTFPWLLLRSGQTFITYINYYSAFFGPILGCMLAQYWFSGSRLAVDELYTTDASSRYWYRNGWNWAAVITTLLVGTVTMVWFLPVSWLVGLPLGILCYALLSRVMQ